MLPPNESFLGPCSKKGVNRRRFMKFCTAMTATLALPPRYVAQVAVRAGKDEKAGAGVAAVPGLRRELGSDPPVQPSVGAGGSAGPLSWEYHEIDHGGAGHQAEAALQRVVKEEKGKYLAVVEGAIPLADDGVYCTVGGQDGARHRARGLQQCGGDASRREPVPGTAGWWGRPRIPRARWASRRRCRRQVINLGGCPQNPANTAAVLVHYLTFGGCRRWTNTTGRCSRTDASSTTSASGAPTTTPVGTSRSGATRVIARAGACTRWGARARRQPSIAPRYAGTTAPVGR